MLLFNKRPFVPLFIFLASGILCGSFLDTSIVFVSLSFSAVIIFILLEILGLLKGSKFQVVLYSILFLLGSLLFIQSSHRKGLSRFDAHYSDGSVCKLKLLEIGSDEGEWQRCIAKLESIEQKHGFESMEVKVLLFIQHPELELKKGDEILTVAKISSIRNKGNPGEFNAEKYWNDKRVGLISFISGEEYELVSEGRSGFLENFTDKVRAFCLEVFRKNFDGQEKAVLAAIVLGDKSMLDMETKESFMNTGAMHVLAVSGLHIGLILYLLMFILERFSKYISRQQALIGLLVFLWFYALLTGSSPSVVRAVFMFSMLSLSQLFSRNYDPLNILFFTAFVLVVIDPYTLFDIGFQLSYLAMVGIFLFYQPITSSLKVENWILKKAWEGTAIGFAAQIMTTPLSLYYFKQFPNYFILSNLGLMVTSGLILGLGLLVVIISKIPILLKPVSFILTIVLTLSILFLAWVEKLPGAVAYGYDLNWMQALLLLIGVYLLFYSASIYKRLMISGALLIGAVAWMAVDRYQKMTFSEIRIFNHSRPLIIAKDRSEIHCFYAAKSAQDFNKVKMIIESYSKYYPGMITYVPVSGKKVLYRSENNNLIIEDRGKLFNIQANDKKFMLKMSNGEFTNDNTYDLVVGMPWVKNRVDHSLEDGSIVLN